MARRPAERAAAVTSGGSLQAVALGRRLSGHVSEYRERGMCPICAVRLVAADYAIEAGKVSLLIGFAEAAREAA